MSETVTSANGVDSNWTEEMEVQVEERIHTFQHAVDPYKRTKDKVAIVGFTDHRKQAFDLGDDFELWGLNELYRYEDLARFHRWFEIHLREDLETTDDGKQHMKDLGGFNIPIYMHKHHDDIPASMPFPKDELERGLGSGYFTSTPAWMVGMAIAMGFKEIHVYGIDLAQDTEYAEQRPCMEYWLGRAQSAGIKLHLPPTSDLLSAIGQYGYELAGKFSAKIQERLAFLHNRDNAILARLREMETKFNEIKASYEKEREALLFERMQMVGAIQDSNFYKRSWGTMSALNGRNPVPDRSQDPMTGIKADE